MLVPRATLPVPSAIVKQETVSPVQVWGYDQGHCFFSGIGHSGTVNRVRVSPDNLFIVSVGSEGGIFVWHYKAPGEGDAVLAEADAIAAAPVAEAVA